ncbi:MAG TPA: protein-export chaperone SecB [Rhodospirillaceae bacterium]|nr:protein-export chaperone SecB [Rhodospirillaceae bacterium]HAA92343.1 protein-export chaperone SecB [Rhodospirillaceae bacterium]HAT35101.1 protein-export chaperone SecB [Rhodospirillaceae bacterium]
MADEDVEVGSEAVMTDAPIDITHQYIKDLSFENPQSPRFLVEAEAAPEIALHINANARPLGDRRFEVILLLEASARHNDEVVFIAELQYGGHVVVGEVDEEHVQPLLLIEAPRMLFPFARQILSNTVRDGGFPPLLLNPVDFVDLYAQGIMVNEEDGEDEDGEKAN